jgi:hypothetical protein
VNTAQHCLDQAEECRRLMKVAHSEAEAYALKILARSWLGLAGQIDRYITLMRAQRGFISAEDPGGVGPP